VHIEVSPDLTGASQNISVLRSDPVLVTIKREPILSEANIVSARAFNAMGGFALEFKFDENGTWLLEQYSAANPGAHFVIFGQWGKKNSDGRWLADPVIGRRISNGTLVFHAPTARARRPINLCSASTRSRRETTKKYSNDFSRG